MRIRHGFVSNSSSTSFCIFGLAVKMNTDDEWENIEEKVECSDTELETFYGDPDSWERMGYIGIDRTYIGNDETGQQFKDRVAALVEQIVPGQGENCENHEESYYNG